MASNKTTVIEEQQAKELESIINHHFKHFVIDSIKIGVIGGIVMLILGLITPLFLPIGGIAISLLVTYYLFINIAAMSQSIVFNNIDS